MKLTQLSLYFYRLAVTCWIGGASLFTFVLTPIIFKTYDRDTAGTIVGTLFPGYFKWGLCCGVLALVAIFLSATIKRRKISAAIIAVMLALTSVQALVIEPKAAELKKQIPSFITTPKDDPLRVQFGKLHAASAGLNLAVIGSGLILLAFL